MEILKIVGLLYLVIEVERQKNILTHFMAIL